MIAIKMTFNNMSQLFEVIGWCRDEFGYTSSWEEFCKGSDKYDHPSFDRYFLFESKEDATLFQLTWC